MRDFAVVWDWNGTIVDDSQLFVEIMNFFLKEQHLPLIDVEIYRESFEFPIINYYRRLGFDFKKVSFESLGSRFIDIYKEKRFNAGLFCGIFDIIRKLHEVGGIQLVVSAQENSLLTSSVKYYGLHNYFRAFRGVDNIFAVGKVELAVNLKNKYLSDVGNVFVVGDSLKDLSVARALNASPVLVSYGHYAKHRLVGSSGATVLDSVSSLNSFFLNKLKTIN